MMGHFGEFGWWGMGFGVIFMVLFWLLIILGIAALIRWLQPQSGRDQRTRDKTSLEIVQERYARGDIDRDEYEQKRRDLESPQ